MAKKNTNSILNIELNDNIIVENSIVEKSVLKEITKDITPIKQIEKTLKFSDYIDFVATNKMTKDVLRMKYKQYTNSVKTISEWNELIKL